MSKSKDKKKEWYYKWWIWAIIIFSVIFIKNKAENFISPIILLIGLLCIAFCAWRLWTKYNSQSEDNEKKPGKVLIIVMITGVLLALLGYCTLGIDGVNIQQKEKLLKVEFVGIDENSSPLAASNLRLLKNNYNYTLVGTLKKTSKEPKESYFDFEIIFIDKNGKYIATEKTSIRPTPTNDVYTLFTLENSIHLQKEIYAHNADVPVKVEFANIKEHGKDEFISITLKDAQEQLKNNNFSSAQQYINLALEYTPITEEIQALLEQAQQGTTTPSTNIQEETHIIGSDKETVRKILNEYEEKTSLMGENAIDFDSDDLLITVFFTNDKADGVVFLSNNLDDIDTLTGEGSYVSQHYDELLKMTTDNTDIQIESDLTKYNSQGNKKYMSELYIGNTPYHKETDNTTNTTKSTATPTSTKSAETKADTSKESQFESLVFFNVGVKVYRYKDESSYLGTIKKVDRDYKDENGKKVGAVYLTGGKEEGWYHKQDLARNCYIRSDDPYKMGY